MDLFEMPLNQMPYHLDILAFWAVALSIGLGGALAIKRLSEAVRRTDQISVSLSPSAAEEHAAGDRASTIPATAAKLTPTPRNAAASAPERLAA
jgi:hypothetical protein